MSNTMAEHQGFTGRLAGELRTMQIVLGDMVVEFLHASDDGLLTKEEQQQMTTVIQTMQASVQKLSDDLDKRRNALIFLSRQYMYKEKVDVAKVADVIKNTKM